MIALRLLAFLGNYYANVSTKVLNIILHVDFAKHESTEKYIVFSTKTIETFSVK